MRAPLQSQLFDCYRISEFRYVDRFRFITLIRSNGSRVAQIEPKTLPLLPASEFQIYVRFGIVIALVSNADLKAINLHIELESAKAGILHAPIIREFSQHPQHGFINPTGIQRELIGSGPTVSSIRRSLREELAPGSHTQREWRQVMARDGYRCLCCGSKKRLSKDHIQPIASGGSNDVSNLQTLCIPCNSRKGNRTIDYRSEMAMTA